MQQKAREIKNKIPPTYELSLHQQIAPGKKEQSCQLFLCRIGITWASKDMIIVDSEVVRSLLSEKSLCITSHFLKITLHSGTSCLTRALPRYNLESGKCKLRLLVKNWLNVPLYTPSPTGLASASVRR